MEYVGRIEGAKLHAIGRDEPVTVDADLPDGTWVHHHQGTVRILAEADSARGEVYALAAKHHLNPVLPEACEREAAAFVRDPGTDDPTLWDGRHLPMSTMDYETSKDLDQALAVEKDGTGWVVWYALADGAHYVRPGSALFDEALRRGATYYLPELAVTMLPHALCEDIMSLNPGVDRRALLFRMAIDAKGRCTDCQVKHAVVRSRAKLAYGGVQAWYDGGDAPTSDGATNQSLRLLAEVGEALIRDATSRNVVRYRRREISVEIDGRGMHFIAGVDERHDTERYSEQISLLTNVQGAEWLARHQRTDQDVHPVYRVHAPPEEERLRQIAQRIRKLVHAHDLPDSWRWEHDGERSLADYLRRLPTHGPQHGIARAIQRQVLFAGGRSGYQAAPDRHHGVGADVYARFTAPMREAVGIFLHKEVAEGTDRQAARPLREDDRTREAIISAATAAKRLQRKLNKSINRSVLDRLFEADLATGKAPWRSGVLLSLGKGRLYVALDDPAVDVHTSLRDVEVEGLSTNSAGTSLRRHDQAWAHLGDTVQLRVRRLDPESDRWCLAVRR